MSRARRDRDDWDVGAPPAPDYGAVQLALLNSPDLGTEFAAVLRFDDQSIALQLGRARWPHEKRNVGPALEEHSAKISPEGARA